MYSLGPKSSRKEPDGKQKKNPVMMGSHIMEESPEEKYLGNMIHTDGLVASILSTVNRHSNFKNKYYPESGWKS